MASDSSRKRLPFEPGKPRTGANKSAAKPTAFNVQTKGGQERSPEVNEPGRSTKAASSIPEAVSRRMLKRMLIFSGVPTFFGVATFFISYFLLVNNVVELPSYFVLFATLGCFGLGVLGLSYGALSASWDEARLGHWFGLDEFKVNFGRLTGAWGPKSDR